MTTSTGRDTSCESGARNAAVQARAASTRRRRVLRDMASEIKPAIPALIASAKRAVVIGGAGRTAAYLIGMCSCTSQVRSSNVTPGRRTRAIGRHYPRDGPCEIGGAYSRRRLSKRHSGTESVLGPAMFDHGRSTDRARPALTACNTDMGAYDRAGTWTGEERHPLMAAHARIAPDAHQAARPDRGTEPMPGGRRPKTGARDAQRYGAAWSRARLACLQAARWRCEIRLGGCAGTASEVDHVDGAGNDPHHRNLRAACKPCHAKVTAQQGHDGRRGSSTGRDPPCTPRTRGYDRVRRLLPGPRPHGERSALSRAVWPVPRLRMVTRVTQTRRSAPYVTMTGTIRHNPDHGQLKHRTNAGPPRPEGRRADPGRRPGAAAGRRPALPGRRRDARRARARPRARRRPASWPAVRHGYRPGARSGVGDALDRPALLAVLDRAGATPAAWRAAEGPEDGTAGPYRLDQLRASRGASDRSRGRL